MAAETSSLVVPASQSASAFWLRLAECIAEHVEEIVGVRLRQLGYEFVAVLDELAVVAAGILVQNDLAEFEGLKRSARGRARGRFGRYGDCGLRREAGAGDLARERVRASFRHVGVVSW